MEYTFVSRCMSLIISCSRRNAKGRNADTLVHSGIEKGIFELRREKKTKISKKRVKASFDNEGRVS